MAQEKCDNQHTDGHSEEQEKSGCVEEMTEKPEGVATEQAKGEMIGEERGEEGEGGGGGEGAPHRGQGTNRRSMVHKTGDNYTVNRDGLNLGT